MGFEDGLERSFRRPCRRSSAKQFADYTGEAAVKAFFAACLAAIVLAAIAAIVLSAGRQGIYDTLHAGRRLGRLIYFEDEPGRRSAAKLLTRDETRRIATHFGTLPKLFQQRRRP
jgi:hypothetical protein